MKATSGSLRIDQNYTFKDSEYHGKFENSLSAETCQNCGMLISNVAIVEGQADKIIYRIGLDCASTLTSINPNDIAEAKKKLAKRAKFLKFMKLEAKSIVAIKGGTAWVYTKVVNKWESFWKYRVDCDYNLNVIEKSGLPIIWETRETL